jgi:hypothetical protein
LVRILKNRKLVNAVGLKSVCIGISQSQYYPTLKNRFYVARR